MGITTLAFLKGLHRCINVYPLGLIYYFPTDRDVSYFSKSRIKPLIQKNEEIRRNMADTDEVGLKQVGKSFMYFRGMHTTTAVKSVPADEIVVDEMDEAAPDKIDMARKRLSASLFKREFYLSNPTFPDYGIDKLFKKSDQRFWLLKCPHCGDWNCLEDNFPGCLVQSGTDPVTREPQYIIGCKKCGKELDKNAGEWVPKYPDRFGVRGYHYTQLFSPTVSGTEIHREYVVAQNTGRLNIFHNLTLGMAYLSAKTKLTVEQVKALGSPAFPRDPFKGDRPVYMGVDQGKDLHIVFKRRGPFGRILTWFDILKDFEALDKYLRDKVTLCVIDALPETRKARELAARFPGKVYLNFYNDNQKGAPAWNEREYIVQENRTESLDASHDMIAEGRNVYPISDPLFQEYAEHCAALAKKLEEDPESGSKRYVWIKTDSADHFRHADNYATIAMQSRSGDQNIIIL
jgi:hypothetical protein